jgi:2-keto-4-pentenoate hydratase
MQDPALRIAALLLDAHANGRRIAPDDTVFTLEDAYRIQELVARELGGGERVRAWKVIPPEPGAEPRAAPIPPGRVHETPARIPAAGLHGIGIEGEIAFRFGRDLPPRSTPYADEEVASAVEEALVTIEVCDTRLAGEAPALWKLADLQSNAALVAGTGARGWRSIDFAKQRVEQWIDGALQVERTGSHATLDPFRIVPWIARHCGRRAGGFRAGDLVTCGSWTGITFVKPGARIRVRFPGIGEAQAEIIG